MSEYDWGARIGPGLAKNSRQIDDDLKFIEALKAIHPSEIFKMGDSRRWAAEQEEEQRLARDRAANHPTIHCNRIEPAGNVDVHSPDYQGRSEPLAKELAPTLVRGVNYTGKPASLNIARPSNFGAHMTIPEEVLQRAATEFPEKVNLEPSHEPHGVGSHELPDVVSPEEWIDRYTHISACKAILLLEAGFLRSVPQDETWGALRKFIQTTIDFTFDGRVWDIVKQKYLDVGWNDPIQVKGATELPGKTVVRLHFP